MLGVSFIVRMRMRCHERGFYMSARLGHKHIDGITAYRD